MNRPGQRNADVPLWLALLVLGGIPIGLAGIAWLIVAKLS